MREQEKVSLKIDVFRELQGDVVELLTKQGVSDREDLRGQVLKYKKSSLDKKLSFQRPDSNFQLFCFPENYWRYPFAMLSINSLIFAF